MSKDTPTFPHITVTFEAPNAHTQHCAVTLTIDSGDYYTHKSNHGEYRAGCALAHRLSAMFPFFDNVIIITVDGVRDPRE